MNCVLDLDGTIVFTEPAEIVIPGRTRFSYISACTAKWLERIGENCSLYIATMRNAESVAQIVRALPRVCFAGFVTEGGLVCRDDIFSPPERSLAQIELSNALANQHPEWIVLPGYEQMICCIATPSIKSEILARQLVLSCASTRTWHSHLYCHKLFLYPSTLCKYKGLRQLGVENIHFAAGDDDIYDRKLLENARRSYALASAGSGINQLLRKRGGTLVASASHRGAVEFLKLIYRDIVDNSQ